MNGASHEFFANDADTLDRAVPLSECLDERLQQQNEAMRDSTVPDYFVIPERLREPKPDAVRTIRVVGNAQLCVPGETSTRYQPNQVRALNVIFEAVGLIAAPEIVEKTSRRDAAVKSQLWALEQLYDKVQTTGGFLMRLETDDGTPAFAVDPKTDFIDRRDKSRQLPDRIQERQRILSTVCKRFGNDPALLRELGGYSMRPLEHIPEDWRMHDVAQHQIKDFELIPRNGEHELIDELDDIIEACTLNKATEADQLRAAVLCNKLIYSYLGLGHAVAFSTLGIAGGRTVKSSVREFMANFPNNTMDKPEDDAYALAGLGVVKAIYTYDKSKGALASHVITQVGIFIRDGVLDDRRHMYGKTHHEMESERATSGAVRRTHVSGVADEDGTYSDLPEPRILPIDGKLEELIRDVNAGPLVRAMFRSDKLSPAQRLILSLTQGVYNEDFEGQVLQGADGRAFVYGPELRKNPFFREGLTEGEISRMFSVSTAQVARLRQAALRSVAGMMKSRLITEHVNDKWKDWVW